MHWDILDKKRTEILPLFAGFAEMGFYLAGGTGLALQIGHRDSIDFDFFVYGNYDTDKLKETLSDIFKEHKIIFTQEEKNTVSCVVDDEIKLSFFGYKHKTIKTFKNTEYFKIASIEDIGCMKLSAITSRSIEKDYIDLYFILKTISLKELLKLCLVKYPTLDENFLLKALIYFDDIKEEKILFKEGFFVSLDDIKKYLQEIVTEYFA
jgi:hypothetical protein